MAEYLASIFGTEKDKVNCSFYFKIGACRHGDRCSRIHNKPTFSQTILIQNLYQNPQNVPQGPDGQPQGVSLVSDEEAQEHFDDFFQDVFVELEDKYGEIEEMNVCDNLGDHLIGNVYIKFRREEDAERAVKELNNRWFNGKPVYAELSPVTDFREACCRQYEMGECTRSGFCNFMHLKPISRELRRELYGRRRPGRRSRSRSPKRRPRERTPDRRRRSKSREHKRRRSRSRSKRREVRTEEPRSRSRDRRRRSEERRNGSSHKPDSSMPLDKEQINIEINSNLDEILNAASCEIKLEQHNGNRHEKQLSRNEEDDYGGAQSQLSTDQHASQESYQNQEELYYQDFGPVKAESAQEEQNYKNDYEQQEY